MVQVRHPATIILVADDGAFCDAIDGAILDLADLGLLNRIDAFANYGRLPLLTQAQKTAIGIHLNLTSGKPLRAQEEVRSLTSADGLFLGPSRSSANDLARAIDTYLRTFAKKLKPDEACLELTAQLALFKRQLRACPKCSSFHHDIDRDPTIRMIGESVLGESPGRQTRVENRTLASFKYCLLPHGSRAEYACNRIVQLVSESIEASRANRGRPVEIAIHPALSTDGLSEFTAYQEQRVLEYQIWKSDPIWELLKSGRNTTTEWIFE